MIKVDGLLQLPVNMCIADYICAKSMGLLKKRKGDSSLNRMLENVIEGCAGVQTRVEGENQAAPQGIHQEQNTTIM